MEPLQTSHHQIRLLLHRCSNSLFCQCAASLVLVGVVGLLAISSSLIPFRMMCANGCNSETVSWFARTKSCWKGGIPENWVKWNNNHPNSHWDNYHCNPLTKNYYFFSAAEWELVEELVKCYCSACLLLILVLCAVAVIFLSADQINKPI